MFFSGHHHGLARRPTAFFRSTIREREPPMVRGEKYCHESWVAVHDRFLVRTILDTEHTHAIVFLFHCVILRINLNRISRDHADTCGRSCDPDPVAPRSGTGSDQADATPECSSNPPSEPSATPGRW